MPREAASPYPRMVCASSPGGVRSRCAPGAAGDPYGSGEGKERPLGQLIYTFLVGFVWPKCAVVRQPFVRSLYTCLYWTVRTPSRGRGPQFFFPSPPWYHNTFMMPRDSEKEVFTHGPKPFVPSQGHHLRCLESHHQSLQ